MTEFKRYDRIEVAEDSGKWVPAMFINYGIKQSQVLLDDTNHSENAFNTAIRAPRKTVKALMQDYRSRHGEDFASFCNPLVGNEYWVPIGESYPKEFEV